MALHPTVGTLKPDSEPAAWWKTITGDLDVPLCGPISMRIETPHGVKECYQIDVKRLTTNQLCLLAKRMSDRFNVPYAEVEKSIQGGAMCPILAEHFSTVAFDARRVL